METKLSPHFSLREMLVTKTGLSNVHYGPSDIDNLRTLCRDVLEPIREFATAPIIVTSGYRDYLVNKAVGGAKNSEHMYGRAADIHCDMLSAQSLFTLIRSHVSAGDIHVGQCILYPKSHFVHVSIYSPHHQDEFIVKH